MKQFVIPFILGLLLLVGCGGEDVLPTIVPTTQLPTSTSTTPPPIIVPTMQLPTDTPELLEITNTRHPPADTPTPRATATEIPINDSQNLPSFSLPTMEGKILFVWAPGIKPDPAIGGEDDTVFNGLYMASPSGGDSEWTVDTIVGETAISKTRLSPDRTKLAFFYLEDTNDNGHYHNLDGDIYKLGVYDIAKNSITTLGIDGYIYGLSWVDDQTLVISQNTNFAFIKIDGTSPIWLTDNPSQPIEGEAYNLVNSVTSSPDGQLQAVARMLGIGISDSRIQPTGEIQLSIYNVLTDQSIPVIKDNEPGNYLYTATVWSPDSQWLAAVPGYKNDSLTLVNGHTLETIPFSISGIEDMVIGLPTWSYGSQWLAFVVNGQDLWFWETSTFIQYKTANKIITSREPVWSPQEERVIVSFTEDEKGGWLIINPASGASDEFYIDMIPYGTPVWSPDGRWVLFPAAQDEMSGYYILDTQSGEASLVFDTTGLRELSNLIWIAN